MPLYDFKCVECKWIMQDVMQPISAAPPACSKCTAPTERFYTASAPVHMFKEGFYEHLAAQPIHFSNKRDLRRYCRENNLTMDYCE